MSSTPNMRIALITALFMGSFVVPAHAAALNTEKAPSTPPIVPIDISIPSAKIFAAIIPVGTTTTNNLDTPHNFTQAGWYKYGTLPGQIGNAVIDGHVDNGGSIPGPFKHLDSVHAGDQIAILDSNGKTLHYTVVYSNGYDYRKFPSDLVFNGYVGSYLKIITCHGQWLPKEGTYDERLVVTAVLNP